MSSTATMMPKLAGLLLVVLAVTCTTAAAHEKGGGFYNNVTSVKVDQDVKCVDGLMLKVWMPQENISFSDRFIRGMVYFLILAYLFIGVSIVSDRFMAAIEVITSKEKEVQVRKPNGETQIVVVRVWNETVANLTLMALGSSAPEILLSII